MKHISAKLDIEAYIKFRYICRCHYYRPMTKQLARLAMQFIADYEKEHGDIFLEEYTSDHIANTQKSCYIEKNE